MDRNLRNRRRMRLRGRVLGSAKKPRACVFRSLRQLEVQLLDDEKGQTLLAVSSRAEKTGTKLERSKKVGSKIAAEAKKKGIKEVVFDRNGYMYHGRVKAVAEAMREGGLEF